MRMARLQGRDKEFKLTILLGAGGLRVVVAGSQIRCHADTGVIGHWQGELHVGCYRDNSPSCAF